MSVDQTLFEKELREILGELADTVCVDSAMIVPPDSALAANDEDLSETLELGNGASLHVRFKSGESNRSTQQHSAALERAARAIRACARRWGIDTLPALTIHTTTSVTRERIVERVEVYLGALCGTQNTLNAAVTLHDEIVASATPLSELHRDRVPFILKQLAAGIERNRGDSSHAEIVGEDFLAQTFWFGAALIAFYVEPCSIDFLRHRTRMVIRELAGILPSLDDPPRDPAKTQPVPE